MSARDALCRASQDGPWLLVLSGLPASGKSAFRRQAEAEGIPARVVSPDDLRPVIYGQEFDRRYEDILWRTTYSLLNYWLSRGIPVMFDATNLTRKVRTPLIGVARRHGARVWAVFFDVPLDVALERNGSRERQVPAEAVRDMASRLEPPSLEEGFDEVIVINTGQGA